MRAFLFILFIVPTLLIAQKQIVLKGNMLFSNSKCEEKVNLNFKIIKIENEQLFKSDSVVV
ncbi:MAG: hypothetical protein EB100_08925, partial [Crocinitomicaceae bacterium]|nr:hypothetical protein [Crocinitomicaceae bacterium]